MRRNGTGRNGGARARKPDESARRGGAAKRQARAAARRAALQTAGLVAFAALIYVVIISGAPPLGVEIGKPAPRNFTARTAFTDTSGARLAAGEVFLSGGTLASGDHLEDLRLEGLAYRSSPDGRLVRIQRYGGLVIALLVLVAGAALYAQRYRPELLVRGRKMLALILLTLLLGASARYCVITGATPLWVPVPLIAMIMCLVYDQRLGLSAALFYSLLTRLACPGGDFEFLVLLIGAMTAALLSDRVRARSTLIKVGLLTGAVMFCTAWALGLLTRLEGAVRPMPAFDPGMLQEALAALANGVLSGFVVSGLLPAIERLFNVTTDVRLLELSDPNQPLLQRLLLDAPGTYHHSMIIGSLAAEAAESIGANPLLARVSAYFHDVGKLRKPEYFAENVAAGAKNPHDELSPSMSNLIITSHPKEGAEMAEKYGIPREVRDIIVQSHGTSVVKYFWNKARTSDGAHADLEESDFRYKLPKPASKEAAIIMLCDAVESTGRSMDSPSTGQIRNMVHDTIMDRLHDGQLDESTLAITDLKRLEDSLVHSLTAAFHSRISYPGQQEGEGAADRQQAPEQVATGEDRDDSADGDRDN